MEFMNCLNFVRTRGCACVCVCVCVCGLIRTTMAGCFCLHSYTLFCVVIVFACVSWFCYVFGAQFDVFHRMAMVYSH